MSFVRLYTAVDAADLRSTAAARVALIRQWMSTRPRELFAELRHEHPIFPTPAFVLLSRHAEVAEVLGNDEVFQVHPYDERLQPLLGGFLLGSEDGPVYEREASLLKLAVRRTDAGAIAAMADQVANLAVAVGRRSGHLDAVHGLLQPIVAGFAARYLGIPGRGGDRVLLRWARGLTHAVLCDPDGDARVQDAAMAISMEFRGYLDVLIAARRSQIAVGGPAGDDALGRLLAIQASGAVRVEQARIRDLLIGTIVSAIEPTVSVGARAIAEVARRPEVQSMVRQAASTEDHAILSAITAEALRFAAPLWTPIRVCTSPYTLARGTVHETVLRPYTRVLASTFAAGFDPVRIEEPERFAIRRTPPQAPVFGVGLHACAGRHIALVLVRAALAALLRGGPVRMTAEIGHVGPFPDLVPLEFLPG